MAERAPAAPAGKEGAMPARKLRELLDGEGVKYVSITHSPAFTAPEIAASAHIPGKQLAKTVVVKLDGKIALAVLLILTPLFALCYLYGHTRRLFEGWLGARTSPCDAYAWTRRQLALARLM